ncbi:hypothetical protein A9Q81_11720 [Gammaproteobacteria bacterium 42_54_T18]|nr:hypothetical protein A9Q81_11720 [Gammaproteobacteria bacterium 42_54_T18]
MQEQIDALKRDHHALDKALAICVSRVDRNENEVKDLSKTVHDTQRVVGEINVKLEKQETFTKEQFATMNEQHKTVLATVEGLAGHVTANTKSNLKLHTVYKTLCVISACFVTAVGVASKLGWV